MLNKTHIPQGMSKHRKNRFTISFIMIFGEDLQALTPKAKLEYQVVLQKSMSLKDARVIEQKLINFYDLQKSGDNYSIKLIRSHQNFAGR